MTAAPGAGQTVDRGQQHRHEQGQHEHRDRPAGHHLVVEQDVGRGGGQVGAAVQGRDRGQHGATHGVELIERRPAARRAPDPVPRTARSGPPGCPGCRTAPARRRSAGRRGAGTARTRSLRPTGSEACWLSSAATVLRSTGERHLALGGPGHDDRLARVPAGQITEHEHGVDRTAEGRGQPQSTRHALRARGRGQHHGAVQRLARQVAGQLDQRRGARQASPWPERRGHRGEATITMLPLSIPAGPRPRSRASGCRRRCRP